MRRSLRYLLLRHRCCVQHQSGDSATATLLLFLLAEERFSGRCHHRQDQQSVPGQSPFEMPEWIMTPMERRKRAMRRMMRSHALLLEEVRSLRRRLLKPSVAWSFGREGPAACPSREEASQQAPPPPFDSALKWPRLRRPHRLPCLSYHLAVEGVEEAPFESAFLAGQFINSLLSVSTTYTRNSY